MTANVLLTTRIAKVNSYKVGKENKSYNTDKLPKHDCKNEIPDQNDKKRGCLPNAKDINKVLGFGERRKNTDTDKPTLIDTQKTLHRKGRDNKLYTTQFTYSA